MVTLIRKRRPKTAIVLGCGPAGLFATHALVEAGWTVRIFSRKRPSQIFGAQYLHEPIPGLPEWSQEITYRLVGGTTEEYRHKVYGDTHSGAVSPELITPEPHKVWDLRYAYATAWERYAGLVEDVWPINTQWIDAALRPKSATLVLSTIPAPVLCYNSRHIFREQLVWAIGDAPELGRMCPIECPDGTVMLDGSKTHGWYRVSNIFGYKTAEWPHEPKPPLTGLAEVSKPILTTCDCYPWIRRLGRYGTYSKTVLTHHAYAEARRLVHA